MGTAPATRRAGGGVLRPMLTLLAMLAVVYVGALLLVFVMQRQFIYLPDSRVPALPELGAGEVLSAVETTASDGVTVTSWYRPAASAERPFLVLFHGNAGNIGDRLFKIAPFLQRGWGVLLAGYRGYGGNPGTPTEHGLYDDGRAALAWLARAGVPADQLVLYGESLGAGVAVQMALETPAAALVLEAPFTSLADMAQRRFPIFPSRWLVRDRFDSIDKVARLTLPLLVIHGERDVVTPAALGRRLYEAAHEPKTLQLYRDAGHVDLYDHGAAAAVIEFVETALETQAPAAIPSADSRRRG